MHLVVSTQILQRPFGVCSTLTQADMTIWLSQAILKLEKSEQHQFVPDICFICDRNSRKLVTLNILNRSLHLCLITMA